MNNEKICFIVEGESDWIYIKKYIDKLLKLNNKKNFKTLRALICKGKGNLIKKHKKEASKKSNENISFVLVFDIDNMCDYKVNKDNAEIYKFISESNVEYIFFNKDIEDVFNIKLDGISKINRARKYNFKDYEIEFSNLKNEDFSKFGSNLYIILSKLLDI